MQEPLDRAAMIEAASRNLRQQLVRGGARERPRSKGSLHDGGRSGTATWVDTSAEPRTAENAQRRIRSAENQHRLVSAVRDPPISNSPPDAPAESPGTPPGDEEEGRAPSAQLGLEDAAAAAVPLLQDLHQELKRPLSRKKDPSASAAAGLGAFAGPARMTDAFEQRKTRQPIPVESWGPRPPSRAGLPPKAVPLDSASDADPKLLNSASRCRDSASSASGRPASKVSNEQAFGSMVVGGTWAAARAEPRALGDARRGRERKAANRGTPEVPPPADLGIFGCGQLSKSLSGSFDQHSSQFREAKGAPRQVPGNAAEWVRHPEAAVALEVSGCGITDAAAQWCGSPPTRKGRSIAEAVSVEDVDADIDLGLHGSYRRDATPPQVIVTRAAQPGKSRGDVRRSSDQRGAREKDKCMPFTTSLDVDFLSLFAS